MRTRIKTTSLLGSLFIFALLVSGCGEDVTGPSADEEKVIGSWAGSHTFTEEGVTFIATLKLLVNADKTYSATMSMNFPDFPDFNGDVFKETGTWKAATGNFTTTATECQEADQPGETMKLVACEDPVATVSINIEGDTWNINEVVEGEGVVTIPLKRL